MKIFGRNGDPARLFNAAGRPLLPENISGADFIIAFLRTAHNFPIKAAAFQQFFPIAVSGYRAVLDYDRFSGAENRRRLCGKSPAPSCPGKSRRSRGLLRPPTAGPKRWSLRRRSEFSGGGAEPAQWARRCQLSAGQPDAPFPHEGVEAVGKSADYGQDIRLTADGLQFLVGCVRRGEQQIVPNAHVEQHAVLHHYPDLPVKAGAGQRIRRHAVKEDRSLLAARTGRESASPALFFHSRFGRPPRCNPPLKSRDSRCEGSAFPLFIRKGNVPQGKPPPATRYPGGVLPALPGKRGFRTPGCNTGRSPAAAPVFR